jgi:hypothetical protein
LVAEALKTANGVVAEVGTSSIVYQTFIGICAHDPCLLGLVAGVQSQKCKAFTFQERGFISRAVQLIQEDWARGGTEVGATKRYNEIFIL